MTLILGIDPGSRVTGYGLVRTNGLTQEYVDSGCIKTVNTVSLPEKLAEIFAGVEELIRQFQPEQMAIEKVFMSRSADSALKLGQARGAAIVACANQGIPVFEYEARKMKQAVVGTGAATKSQVQHMVQSLLRLEGMPQSDAADALGIALCHCQTQVNLARVSHDTSHFSRGRLR